MADRRRLVFRIAGGLGNQLFQYATGRRMALQNGLPLTLDHISGFPRDFYRRKYLLDLFNIRCEYVGDHESYATLTGRIRRRLQVRLNRGRPLERKRFVLEGDQSLHPELLDYRVTHPVYFEGYWQHEEYFRDIRDHLLEELTLREPPDAENARLGERIASVEAVCLHVRQLRNVPNIPDAKPIPTAPGEHLDSTYYQRAAERLAERVTNPHFFVFADYPNWAREHIHLPHPVEYITHNGADKDYEDFRLMTRCRHFVLANSTFSWWAAWLGRNPDKVVIAPRAGIGRGLQSVPEAWELI
jgi:hypothetical protein